jgi:hypothetical protein
LEEPVNKGSSLSFFGLGKSLVGSSIYNKGVDETWSLFYILC